MSAAAALAVAPRAQGEDDFRLPPQFASKRNPKGIRWTATPNAFYDHLFRAHTHLEAAIAGIILRYTAGHPERPEFTAITQERLAALTGATVGGVAKALHNLASQEKIGVRKRGRAMEYRAAVENWDRPAKRPPRKLARKPPASATEPEAEASVEAPTKSAALRVVPVREVMVHIPGEPAPKPLADVCPHGADCAVVRMAEKKRTVKQSQVVNEQIPILEYGDSHTAELPAPVRQVECRNAAPATAVEIRASHGALRVEVRAITQSPVDNKEVNSGKPTLEYGNRDYRKFHSLVAEVFGPRLQAPPPPEILRAEFARLAEAQVPLDYFETRLRLRGHKAQSFGFVRLIVDDCIGACQAARERAAKASRQQQAVAADNPYSPAAIRERLTAAAGQCRRQTAYLEVAATIEQAARDAERHAADVEHLELHLANIEAMARSLAEEQLTPEDRAAIENQAERELARYRGLPQAEYAKLRGQLFHRLLFARAGLPRLSLF